MAFSCLLISAAFLFGSTTASPQTSLVPLRVSTAGFHPVYDVEVTLGTKNFSLVIDTGSSDLWVVKTGYKCFDGATNAELADEDCTFSSTTFDPSSSSTFQPITNETFGATYGLGIALGSLGYENVTVGGITVPHQIIGVADRVTIPGSESDSGIFGLSFPLLTSAHQGTVQPPNDTLLLGKVPYDPIFTRMYKEGLAEPWFSLALERLKPGEETAEGGYFGIGVLPEVELSSDFIKVPAEPTDVIPLELTGGERQVVMWTLAVEAVTWGPSKSSSSKPTTNTTAFQATVDSGNWFNQLPQEVADDIYAAYDPPATLDSKTGLYTVNCDVKPPTLGVTIAGHTFYHTAEDLVLVKGEGVCVSTILPTALGENGVGLNFLGDVFMHNVVSVFDFGKTEMRFAARKDGGGVDEGNGGNGDSNQPTGQTKSMAISNSVLNVFLAAGLLVLAV